MEKNKFEYSKFLKVYKNKIITILFMYLFTLLCSVAIPYILGNVISVLEKGAYNNNYILKAFIVILALYFMWNFVNALVSVRFSYINKSIANDIRVLFYSKLFSCKIGTYNELRDGEIFNRISKDTEKLENAFMNLFYLIISIIYCTLLILFMMKINVLLSLVLMLLFFIIVIFQRILTTPLGQLYKGYKKTEDELFNEIKNNMTSFITIKIFNMKDSIIETFKDRSTVYLNSYIKVSKKIGIIKNSTFFLSGIFKISPIFIGAILYSKNMITIGAIFAMYSYAIQLSSEVRSIMEADIVLKDIKTSYERIQEVMILLDDDKTHIENEDISIKNISFENTNVSYGEKHVLKNINAKFTIGDIVSITGENGSGKSTFVQIICGIIRANGVYYNDIPQENFNEGSLLKEISYMVQEGYLFPTTIMNNITCFNTNLENKAKEVCIDLGIDHRISKLMEGYNTLINEKNSNLSGGEKQLISLARALIRDSSIIILDEPNSSLDKNIEETLKNNVKKYFTNKIVFIISHKGSMEDICNKKQNINKYKLEEV